jgi:hypothetical protein
MIAGVDPASISPIRKSRLRQAECHPRQETRPRRGASRIL